MEGRHSASAVIVCGLAALIARRGAGVRANLSLFLLRRLTGSRRRIRRHAGTRPAGAQAENRPVGPTAFHRYAAEPSVFQLAPRYPPSASWGLRRRLRRGWTGEGIASLPPTIVEPALGGPGDLRWPRYRASVCCSGSPKRIGISSRKQCDRPDSMPPLLSNGQDGNAVLTV